MYINRTIESAILEAAKAFPCIVIYGSRQVGKSTTVDHLFGDSCRYITLDDGEDRALAQNNPRLFMETMGWPLIIDEIQRVPMLLDEIKIRIDRQRMIWMKNNEPQQLMYVLTGSNRFTLQESVSDSLAGRCGVIEMASFSQSEKYGDDSCFFDPDIRLLLERERDSRRIYRSRKELFADIFTGGMPDVVIGKSEHRIYFRSYVDTYIEKDVKQLISEDSETLFRNFISLTALRTSSELHYDILAGEVGVDTRTIKRWLSILETAGIIYLLQPYMPNASSRIIKAPKLYFMDTGLCAYLCKWPTAEMLENGAMSGAFFETFVVSELIKNFYAFNADPKDSLFYYRDKDQKEIDLLYVWQGSESICPIEIKKGIAVSKKRSVKNFKILDKYKMKILPGLVIDSCEKIRPIDENAYFYPAYLL